MAEEKAEVGEAEEGEVVVDTEEDPGADLGASNRATTTSQGRIVSIKVDTRNLVGHNA